MSSARQQDHRGSGGRPGLSRPGLDTHALSQQLSDVARSLEDVDGLQGTLDAIVLAAVDTLPAVDHASLFTVSGRADARTEAATSDVARQVDDAQVRTREGPCLDSLYTHRTVRVDDLNDESRWPRFARAALDAGVQSMLAVQLFVDGDDLGALNLHSVRTSAFDDDAVDIALLFAAHAAVAMAGADHQEQLRTAVSTRDVIGMAKGMLMERFSIDAEQAFRVLVRHSQVSNTRLRDVARALVDSGSLPPGG